jgi:hypothetical protein
MRAALLQDGSLRLQPLGEVRSAVRVVNLSRWELRVRKLPEGIGVGDSAPAHVCGGDMRSSRSASPRVGIRWRSSRAQGSRFALWRHWSRCAAIAWW